MSALQFIDPELYAMTSRGRMAERATSAMARRSAMSARSHEGDQRAPRATEEEEKSLVGSLRDKSLSMLSTVGNVLDLPGSMVRDVGASLAGGKFVNPFDQLLSPFSGENRTTGRQLNRALGLTGPVDTTGNFWGGMATEFLTDPTVPLSLGWGAITKAGKALKATGVIDELPRIAAKKADAASRLAHVQVTNGPKATRYATGTVGPREARISTNWDDVLRFGSPKAKAVAQEVKKTIPGDQMFGGTMGIGVPFMDPLKVVGNGAMAIAAAKAADKAAKAVRFFAIPGTDIKPVNALLNLFDAPARNMKGIVTQALAREHTRAKELTHGIPALDANKAMLDLKEAGLNDRASMDLLRDSLEGIVPIEQLPEVMRPIVAQAKAENAAMAKISRGKGRRFKTLNDKEVDYAARYLVASRAKGGAKGKTQFNPEDPSQMARSDFQRDIPGGTTFLRKLYEDKELNDLIDQIIEPNGKPMQVIAGTEQLDAAGKIIPGTGTMPQNNLDAVRQMIVAKTNGTLPEDWRMFDPKHKNAGPDGWVPKTDRTKKIAEFLSGLSRETRDAGVYGNHPLLDHAARRMMFEDSMQGVKVITDALTEPGILMPRRVAANAKADGSMTVGEFFKTKSVKLSFGDRKGGMGAQILRGIGHKVTENNLKLLSKMRIPKEYAEDLLSLHQPLSGPESLHALIEMTDQFTNYSKGAWTSAWPAFHIRNRIGGAVHNMMLGIWGLRGDKEMHALQRGEVIKGAAQKPWVIAEWNRRQALKAKYGNPVHGPAGPPPPGAAPGPAVGPTPGPQPAPATGSTPAAGPVTGPQPGPTPAGSIGNPSIGDSQAKEPWQMTFEEFRESRLKYADENNISRKKYQETYSDDMLREDYYSKIQDPPREADTPLNVYDQLPEGLQKRWRKFQNDLDGKLAKRSNEQFEAANKPYDEARKYIDGKLANYVELRKAKKTGELSNKEHQEESRLVALKYSLIAPYATKEEKDAILSQLNKRKDFRAAGDVVLPEGVDAAKPSRGSKKIGVGGTVVDPISKGSLKVSEVIHKNWGLAKTKNKFGHEEWALVNLNDGTVRDRGTRSFIEEKMLWSGMSADAAPAAKQTKAIKDVLPEGVAAPPKKASASAKPLATKRAASALESHSAWRDEMANVYKDFDKKDAKAILLKEGYDEAELTKEMAEDLADVEDRAKQYFEKGRANSEKRLREIEDDILPAKIAKLSRQEKIDVYVEMWKRSNVNGLTGPRNLDHWLDEGFAEPAGVTPDMEKEIFKKIDEIEELEKAGKSAATTAGELSPKDQLKSINKKMDEHSKVMDPLLKEKLTLERELKSLSGLELRGNDALQIATMKARNKITKRLGALEEELRPLSKQYEEISKTGSELVNRIIAEDRATKPVAKAAVPAKPLAGKSVLPEGVVAPAKVTAAPKQPQTSVVYHGTHQDFKFFDRMAGYKHTKNKAKRSIDELGIWFTDKPETASELYGPKVVKAEIKTRSPYIIAETEKGGAFRELRRLQEKHGGVDGLREFLFKGDHDSVILKDAYVDGKIQTVTVSLYEEDITELAAEQATKKPVVDEVKPVETWRTQDLKDITDPVKFSAKSPNHARLSSQLDEMTKDGTLNEPQASVVRMIFAQSDGKYLPEMMKGVTNKEATDVTGVVFPETWRGFAINQKVISKVDRTIIPPGTVWIRNPTDSLEQFIGERKNNVVHTVLHEMFHSLATGVRGGGTPGEKALFAKIEQEMMKIPAETWVKEFTTPGKTKASIEHVAGIGEHSGKHPFNERFAEFGAASVLRRKVPQGAFAEIVHSAIEWLKDHIQNLLRVDGVTGDQKKILDALYDELAGFTTATKAKASKKSVAKKPTTQKSLFEEVVTSQGAKPAKQPAKIPVPTQAVTKEEKYTAIQKGKAKAAAARASEDIAAKARQDADIAKFNEAAKKASTEKPFHNPLEKLPVEAKAVPGEQQALAGIDVAAKPKTKKAPKSKVVAEAMPTGIPTPVTKKPKIVKDEPLLDDLAKDDASAVPAVTAATPAPASQQTVPPNAQSVPPNAGAVPPASPTVPPATPVVPPAPPGALPPAPGALPPAPDVLDDAMATRIMGEMLNAYGVIGKTNSVNMDKVGMSAGNITGDMEEHISGIPRPGTKGVSLKRMAKKFIGREPGTSLNPFDVRGVGGREESGFGPFATGEEAGAYMEGMNRGGPWITLMDRGYDAGAAAKKVGAAQVLYGNRNYTNFEQKFMTRLFPFYKFTRGITPIIAKELMEHPNSGGYSAIIKSTNRAQSEGEIAPDYVRDTASIKIDEKNKWLQAIAGTPPEGTDRYLTGLGLMHEDALSFGPSLRGAGLEALSRMNPFIKATLEGTTGQTFFQRGPEGGRDLDDLDPTLGRLVANVMGQTESKDSKKFPLWMEQMLANSPAARLLTTARTITDPRKRMKDSVLPGPSVAINLLSGARIADVSPAARDAIVRELVSRRMKDIGAKAFDRVYFPKEDKANMTPEQLEQAIQLEGLANILADRTKERKKIRMDKEAKTNNRLQSILNSK